MDLWTVLVRGDSRGIEQCLAEGQSPNVPNENGDAPLLVAAAQNAEAAVRTLLDHGARPDATDRQGRTALMRAAEMGFSRVARLLVSAGAEVRKADRRGERALGIALRDPLGWGSSCSEVAHVIAERYPPDVLREELRHLVLQGGPGIQKERESTISGVNASMARLRGNGIPKGLDVSERDRLRMFLDDVGRYDREVRDILTCRETLLKRIGAEPPSSGLLEEIRAHHRRAMGVVTTATQIRMEQVVLERLIGS